MTSLTFLECDVPHCPECGKEIDTPDRIARDLVRPGAIGYKSGSKDTCNECQATFFAWRTWAFIHVETTDG